MPQTDQEYDITNMKIKNALEKIDSNLDGLTSPEVKKRQEKYGLNEISEVHQNPIFKFLGYFWGPIPIMIEVAALLSIFVHHYTDFVVILALLFLNTGVGFWHDRKADHAIELLKQKLAPNARVRRDGGWKIIPARELVPGDIIRIRMGDIIPADIQIIDGNTIECDESALTGESMPVEKHTMNEAYSGSQVTRGEVTAIVQKTGQNTYFGRTAKLVEEAKTKSHFEQALIRIGNYLIVMAIFLVILIFIVALFRHDNLMETLRFALVLTVASIPVALPAILTVTMAVGAVNLAKKKAIVSKLAAIEELAGMDILCSDKTGTLTKNQLSVADVLPSADFQEQDVLLYAALASRKEDNDTIDNAIFSKIEQNTKLNQLISQFHITGFQPFDPVIKRTEAQGTNPENESIKITKGAPQVIFKMIELQNSKLKKYQEKVDDFARTGYRVIAVAFWSESAGWQLIGMIPLYDPPRSDSAQTISNAQSMGIQVKMMTGDNLAIAKQISQKLGLGTKIIKAEKLQDLKQAQLEDIAETSDGFAEVFPEHKFTIVKALQKLKHFVGMTGDGVNDAPALKKADCGIAVSGATDAAKSAASIVLTSPGISIIIDAIKESRKIFQRMNSYAIYRMAETIRVLFFITLSILVFNFYPVTAVMIVLLALLNDAPIMAIANDNVHYSLKPEKWNMRIIFGLGTILGLIGVVSSFLIFYLGQDMLHLGRDVLQSFIFLKLAVAGHLTIFISRTRGPFWSIKPSASLFWSAIVTKIFATLFAVYGWFIAPIGWKLALIVWGYALIAFALTDLIKLYIYRFLDIESIPFNKEKYQKTKN
jgi:H+-transporting ATPase